MLQPRNEYSCSTKRCDSIPETESCQQLQYRPMQNSWSIETTAFCKQQFSDPANGPTRKKRTLYKYFYMSQAKKQPTSICSLFVHAVHMGFTTNMLLCAGVFFQAVPPPFLTAVQLSFAQRTIEVLGRCTLTRSNVKAQRIGWRRSSTNPLMLVHAKRANPIGDVQPARLPALAKLL